VSWKSGEAQTCGVSPQTVSTYRTAQVSKLDTSPGTTREGRDGKQQPATKPKRVTASPEAEQQTADVANDCADSLGFIEPPQPTAARVRSASELAITLTGPGAGAAGPIAKPVTAALVIVAAAISTSLVPNGAPRLSRQMFGRWSMWRIGWLLPARAAPS
jgi:hypothetical protein